jgi:hypothetical protein
MKFSRRRSTRTRFAKAGTTTSANRRGISGARARDPRRARAREREQRSARIVELLRHWGGVTIAYRRRLIDSPSYTLNHEEVEKALEEGIWFAENLTPAGVDVDHYGAARGIRLRHTVDKTEHWFAAHTVFVAAGTQPNTVLAREHPTEFHLQGKYFSACDDAGNPVTPQYSSAKPAAAQVLLAKESDGRFVSYFGDVHPSYFGNVVKAMGSAKQGYPVVSGVLARRSPERTISRDRFFGELADQLVATVHRVERLTRRSSKSSCGRRALRSNFIRDSSIGCRTSNRSRQSLPAPGCRWRASR